MSVVKVPSVLRPNVGGAKEVQVGGGTIGEVIDGLVASYPALKDQLLTPEGDLNRFVNVYLDGQDVRYLQGLETPVPDGETVAIIPAVAGG